MVEEFKSFRNPDLVDIMSASQVATPTPSVPSLSTTSRSDALETILGSLPESEAGFFTNDIGGLMAEYALSDATEVANSEGTWRGTKLENADAFRREHKIDELQAATNAVFDRYKQAETKTKELRRQEERIHEQVINAANLQDTLRREWNDANAKLLKLFREAIPQLRDEDLERAGQDSFAFPALQPYQFTFGVPGGMTLIQPQRNYLANVAELAGPYKPLPPPPKFAFSFATPAERTAADARAASTPGAFRFSFGEPDNRTETPLEFNLSPATFTSTGSVEHEAQPFVGEGFAASGWFADQLRQSNGQPTAQGNPFRFGEEVGSIDADAQILFGAGAGAGVGTGTGWSLAAPYTFGGAPATPTASAVDYMTAGGAQGALVFDPELRAESEDLNELAQLRLL
jgi:hypothetical protein